MVAVAWGLILQKLGQGLWMRRNETKQNEMERSETKWNVVVAWGLMLQKLALITRANEWNETKQNTKLKIDMRVIPQTVINLSLI